MKQLIELAFINQCSQLVDSQLETTRVFWRKKYFNATDAESLDPRPFADVLAERAGD